MAHKLCAIVSCTQLQRTQKEKTLRVNCPHVSMVISENLKSLYAVTNWTVCKTWFRGKLSASTPQITAVIPSSLEEIHIWIEICHSHVHLTCYVWYCMLQDTWKDTVCVSCFHGVEIYMWKVCKICWVPTTTVSKEQQRNKNLAWIWWWQLTFVGKANDIQSPDERRASSWSKGKQGLKRNSCHGAEFLQLGFQVAAHCKRRCDVLGMMVAPQFQLRTKIRLHSHCGVLTVCYITFA